jgi:hypothetical protein
METRTYTEKSNARRAARAAGIDPNLVFATDDGFTFTPPAETNGHDHAEESPLKEAIGLAVERGISPNEFVAIAEDIADGLDSAPASTDDDIPAFCKLSPETRKAAWQRNPPKPAAIKESIMAKAKTAKRSKEPKQSGADKTALLLSMLKGKGSTVEAMTKALDWLPHTLRARISRLPKDDKKIKIERTRADGVTTYRIA